MEKKNIAVIGQGYVGLPLALSFALHGCQVVGVDSDLSVCEQLSKGFTTQTETYKGEPIQNVLRSLLAKGNYQITSDGAEAVRKSNVIVLTVGIPVSDGIPNYHHFEEACSTIGKNIQKDSLILIRSTVVPGTTETFCIPIIERLSGLKAGQDFFIAYVPERIAEGKAFEEFETMPTLIGAADPQSAAKAEEVIRINSQAQVIHSDSMTAVETSKVLENLQRDANIAIVQEFARFAEAAGMNTMEVIRLANTHKRVNLMTPGPGVGGYCIPNAFHYLNAKAQDLNIGLPLFELARTQNNSLPAYITRKTTELINQAGKSILNSKIAIAGLAMKDCSPDDRLSPAVQISQLLQKEGAIVAAYDANVPVRHAFQVSSMEEAVNNADALLILNKFFASYDIKSLLSKMNALPVILDTRETVDPDDLPSETLFWRI